MISLLTRLLREEGGQDLIEYALLTALIGLAAIVAWGAVERAIRSTYASWNSSANSVSDPDTALP